MDLRHGFIPQPSFQLKYDMEMKKILAGMLLLGNTCLQAQTFYNNGATVVVSTGGTLFVDGSISSASGSILENYGTIKAISGVAAATAETAVAFGINGVFDSPSATNHINGYASKTGNQPFLFPVGNGTALRSLQMSAPSSVTDQYNVAWLEGDPTITPDPSNSNQLHPVTNTGTGILSVAKDGQWDWVTISGTGSGLTITASLPDMATYAATASNLRLVGWNGSQWINLSGTDGASGLTEGSTLAGTMQAGIEALGIGSISAALPVVFGNVEASIRGNQVLVRFTSLSETNNDHFSVLASRDGKDFHEIGTLASSATGGNSNSPIDYHFSIGAQEAAALGSLAFLLFLIPAGITFRKKILMASLLVLVLLAACSKNTDIPGISGAGKLFIRIAQVDKDGTKAYSKIVKVKAD